MLKRLENEDISEVISFLGDDAVSVRIKAFILTYKCDFNFIEYWAQFDENNAVTAVLMKNGGICTLRFSDRADTEEIVSLLRFIGFDSLFTDENSAGILGLIPVASGDILLYDNEIHGEYGTESFTDMKKAFLMIKENEGESVTKLDYLEWLSDFTFKSNRGAARIRVINENSSPLSFAMTSGETEDAAIISGVFTDKKKRNQGLGETVLKSLTKDLVDENKKVYIMTATEEMTRYYEKRGFRRIQRWCEIKGEI